MLNIIFPELQYIFESGIHTNTLYTLLKKEKLAALRDKTLISILNKASKVHYKEDHSLQLKSHAKSSKLSAFPGLNPKVRQSGNFNASSCRNN